MMRAKTAVLHIRNSIHSWRWRRLVSSIDALIQQPGATDTRLAEADFEQLQADAPSRPDYGYDPVSLTQRAADRIAAMLKHVPRSDQKLSTLDVATGDGTVGALLAASGFDAALCDLRDWRAPSAKAVPFEIADCCASLPYASDSFDIVSSFNALEHMPDPGAAFGEIVRVTKPGGIIFLDFGPLYASAWGLHASGSIRMAYPQFLFSENFLKVKLGAMGINDLGTDLEDLQYVNGWRVDQYQQGFSHPNVETLELEIFSDISQLPIVRRYPESFRGRGLTFEDLTRNHIRAVFQKKQ